MALVLIVAIVRTIDAQAGSRERWISPSAAVGLGQLTLEWRLTWWKGGRLAPVLSGAVGAYDPAMLLGDNEASSIGFVADKYRLAAGLRGGVALALLTCDGKRFGCMTAVGMLGADYLAGQPKGLDSSASVIPSVSARFAPRADLGLTFQFGDGPVRLALEGRVAALHYSGIGTRASPVFGLGVIITRQGVP